MNVKLKSLLLAQTNRNQDSLMSSIDFTNRKIKIEIYILMKEILLIRCQLKEEVNFVSRNYLFQRKRKFKLYNRF